MKCNGRTYGGTLDVVARSAECCSRAVCTPNRTMLLRKDRLAARERENCGRVWRIRGKREVGWKWTESDVRRVRRCGVREFRLAHGGSFEFSVDTEGGVVSPLVEITIYDSAWLPRTSTDANGKTTNSSGLCGGHWGACSELPSGGPRTGNRQCAYRHDLHRSHAINDKPKKMTGKQETRNRLEKPKRKSRTANEKRPDVRKRETRCKVEWEAIAYNAELGCRRNPHSKKNRLPINRVPHLNSELHLPLLVACRTTCLCT
jgi:hypothetical protein